MTSAEHVQSGNTGPEERLNPEVALSIYLTAVLGPILTGVVTDPNNAIRLQNPDGSGERVMFDAEAYARGRSVGVQVADVALAAREQEMDLWIGDLKGVMAMCIRAAASGAQLSPAELGLPVDAVAAQAESAGPQ